MRIFGWDISRQKRSFENPSVPLSDAIRGVLSDGSTGGVPVNEQTALQLSIIYAVIRIISEDIASLPLGIFEKQKGYFKPVDHEANYLYQVKPNSWQNSFQWKETSTASVCARGNTFSRIITDRRGKIRAIEYLPDQEWQAVWLEDQKKIGYRRETGQPNGKPQVLTSEEVIHIPFTSLTGEVQSVSPLTWLKNSLGISLNAQAYANNTYKSGAFASGFLEMPPGQEMSAATSRQIEDSIIRHHGGATKGMRLIALEDGLTYKPASISPHDIEFVATQQFQVEELLRPWRVPPHLISDLKKSSFSNVEHQSLEYVMFCLRPWAKRWEAELNQKVLTRKEYDQGLRHKINLRALLRGDVKTQTDHITAMIAHGIMTRNEARDILGMPEIEGGDEILVPVNLLNPEENGENEKEGNKGGSNDQAST